MNYQNISAFALAIPAGGYQNQLHAALKAIADLTADPQDIEQKFLLPENVTSPADIKNGIYFSSFDNYNKFRKEIYNLIDAFLQKNKVVPKIFISVYDQGQNQNAAANVDMLCRAVKDYYQQHKLGDIITAVLTSPLHKYQYVDIINAPKHLLTFRSRIRLLRNRKLRKKVLITTGTINGFNRKNVKEKFKELSHTLTKVEKNPNLTLWLDKFNKFKATTKKVVFCLGGRVDGNEIAFDINYAQKLFTDAEKLVQIGYGVIFVNGPRTPNDVTDYLYEKSLHHPHIIFQNCKKIADIDDDRLPYNWRIYSGKNEAVFRTLSQVGNIYPAVLDFENTLVVHTLDSYSCCETANAAIPTAISSNGLHIDPEIRYDCFNLQQLMCPRYAIDWDNFVNLACNMKTEPQDLKLKILSDPLHVFAEIAINALTQTH